MLTKDDLDVMHSTAAMQQNRMTNLSSDTYPYTILLVNQVIFFQFWSSYVNKILRRWFVFLTWWWQRSFFHKPEFPLLWIFNI